MALSTTYNVAGDREDLTDFLTILAPEDTPKVSTFSKTKRMTNAYQEWQVRNISKGYIGREDLKNSVLRGSFTGSVEGTKKQSAFSTASFLNSGTGSTRKQIGFFGSDLRE